MTIYAYLRCSTGQQDEASQRNIILTHYNFPLEPAIQWHSDKTSGGTPWQDRGLAHLLDIAKSHDTIIVSEISRIARSTVGVLTFLQQAAERGVTVIAVKTGITLDDSMQSKIVVTVLGLAAEIERDLLRARTKAALDARKARGLPVGRQLGATGKRNKLAGRESEIGPLLKAGVARTAIARLLGVSRQTLHTFLAQHETALIEKQEVML